MANFSGLKILPALIAVVFTAVCASSCEEEKRTYVSNVSDTENTPTMRTTDVLTLISDSGYTRYEIDAPLWLMFDDAQIPKWTFPEGMHLTQFDLSFRPQASVRSDSATYFTQQKLWRLDGNVVMVSTARDTFLTQQLFWDQNAQKLYSDSFIHIVRQDRIIEGYGFTSNESMTQYDIQRTSGILPIDERNRPGQGQQEAQLEEEQDDNPEQEGSASSETPTTPSRKKAPIRASQRNKQPAEPLKLEW